MFLQTNYMDIQRSVFWLRIDETVQVSLPMEGKHMHRQNVWWATHAEMSSHKLNATDFYIWKNVVVVVVKIYIYPPSL